MSEKITAAAFVACVVNKEGLPKDEKPIVALVGRSNVGKSSLINTVVGRRDMAKTSSTPGKTLTINFYLINDAFYIVDLPGYGYAKASRVTKTRIQTMMNEFFEECHTLKGIVQVMDIRHPPSTLDRQTFAWLRELGINYMSVLTKSDKLGQQQARVMERQYLKDLDLPVTLLFSSKTGQGKDQFIDAIMMLLSGRSVNLPEKSSAEGKRRGPRKPAGAPSQQRSREPRPERSRPDPAREQGAPGTPATRNTPGTPQPTAGNTAIGEESADRSGKTPASTNRNRRRRGRKKPGNGPVAPTPGKDQSKPEGGPS